MSNAFDKELELSADLRKVVGAQKMSRPQVVKKLWEYIKANELQNPENKRNIIADGQLRPIFGKDEVTMFEMNSLISDHMSDPDA